MDYVRAISFCTAVAITSGALFIMGSPVFGRTAPITVTAPWEEVVVRHVSYADLNLASAPGQQMLNRRVNSAVSDLCNEATGGPDGSVSFKFSMMKCSSEAWNGARPQIDRAVQRARDIAYTGTSALAAAAIIISLPR
jgi:UrcA family protein